MSDVFLLLGANLGQPLDQLLAARRMIQHLLGEIVNESAVYLSEAWGEEDQPPFYNQVLHTRTDQSPEETLAICQQIEDRLGRVRHRKWGARTIDIDILYFNDDIIQTKNLTIPHPYLHLRRFTLVPLAEISPALWHPLLGQSTVELLDKCPDTLSVTKIHS